MRASGFMHPAFVVESLVLEPPVALFSNAVSFGKEGHLYGVKSQTVYQLDVANLTPGTISHGS